MPYPAPNVDFNSLEQKYGLPTGLLPAMMQQESGGNPNAVSPRGAQGLFQFMPPTAQQYGINPLDPAQASDGAARMLSDLARKYNGDLPSVLAAYNWGSGNLDRHGMANAPAETQNYISSIMGRLPQQQVAPSQAGGTFGKVASAVGNMIIPQAQAAEDSPYAGMTDEQLKNEMAKYNLSPAPTSQDYSALSDDQIKAEIAKYNATPQMPSPQETPAMSMVRNVGQGAESLLTGLATPFDMLGAPIRAGINAMGGNAQPLADTIRANSPWPKPSGFASDVNRGFGAALPSIALGGGMAAGLGPMATTVGETLAASPLKQMAAGSMGSAAGGAVERAGGSPVAQGMASLGAGAATFGGLAGMQSFMENPSMGTNLMTKGKSLMASKNVSPVSSEDLRSVASQSYKEAADKGGTLTPDFTNKFIQDASSVMPQTEAGKIVAGDSEATKLIGRLVALKDKPLSLDSAQEVDEQLGDMIDGFVKDGKLSKEGLKVAKIQGMFRNMIEGAGPNEIQGGSDGFDALKKGRMIWSQAAKMRDVEKIASRAESMEQPTTGIKSGARTLLNNANKTRGWSEEEKAALRDATKTGFLQDALRIMGSRLTTIAGGSAGLYGGGPLGALGAGMATHAVSSVSRNLAAQMQMNKLNNLQGIIARGAR